RWKRGSVLTFKVESDDFPFEPYRNFATAALKEAAKRWNELDLGVTFKFVTTEPAVFKLVYRTNEAAKQDHLASAFFPDDAPKKHKLKIYGRAFESDQIKGMINVFCHELGHILGLRHDFTSDNDSVKLGDDSGLSIMGYHDDWSQVSIYENDAMWVKLFYNGSEEDLKLSYQIIDQSPSNHWP
ncbi:hypothetical protein EV356DRAFT_457842, partial [Viridothelium virens]